MISPNENPDDIRHKHSKCLPFLKIFWTYAWKMTPFSFGDFAPSTKDIPLFYREYGYEHGCTLWSLGLNGTSNVYRALGLILISQFCVQGSVWHGIMWRHLARVNNTCCYIVYYFKTSNIGYLCILSSYLTWETWCTVYQYNNLLNIYWP